MAYPEGALTKNDLLRYRNLTDDEKRRTKLYWVWNNKLEMETILYRGEGDRKEYHLYLDWPEPIFDNYWHAYAYAITRTDHLKDA